MWFSQLRWSLNQMKLPCLAMSIQLQLFAPFDRWTRISHPKPLCVSPAVIYAIVWLSPACLLASGNVRPSRYLVQCDLQELCRRVQPLVYLGTHEDRGM